MFEYKFEIIGIQDYFGSSVEETPGCRRSIPQKTAPSGAPWYQQVIGLTVLRSNFRSRMTISIIYST